MSKDIDRRWLTPAKAGVVNAQRELAYAITALQRTGGNFDKTIKDINQIIGELHCAVVAFEDEGV